MPSAATLRLQIEAALAQRFPSALTPAPRVIRPVAPTGVPAVDTLLEGGFPVGAITELAGPECSGRTSLALSFLARITRSGCVAAWIDVSDALHPESAAAVGVDLDRVLWVRCGAARPPAPPSDRRSFALPEKYLLPPAAIKGLHGGGCGGHPRGETKGLAAALSGLLQPEIADPRIGDPAIADRQIADPAQVTAPRCAEPQRRQRPKPEVLAASPQSPAPNLRSSAPPGKPWTRLEQAMRVTDLLLQAGGFSAVVLDLGSLAPEVASRVPLATWFRYRAAAERTQASLILLSQFCLAKSSAELLLRFHPAAARQDENTVFTGMECRVEVERRRFAQAPSNVIPLRKPPQRETGAAWRNQSTWAGAR